MRRALLPALLVAASVASAAMAFASAPAYDAAPRLVAAADAPHPPLLTARRAPGYLLEPLSDQRLAAKLASVVAASPGTSCLIVSDEDGIVFESSPVLALVPASAMKLITSLAVLTHLGPESRLRTTVVSAEPPDARGVIDGEVWLVGGGDPVLGVAEWAASFDHQPALYTPLEALADRMVEAGVTAVTGAVVGDEGRYDQVRYVATWPDRYRTDNEVGPMSALSVNDAFLTWEPTTPFVHPAAGAASTLNELLRQRGVTISGTVGVGTAPGSAVELAALESPTMTELVGQMLTESDNGTAELLTKELGYRVGGEGSTAAGTAVMEDTILRAGLPMVGFDAVDGSGLDRTNQVSCRLLQALLDEEDQIESSPIIAGLAVAGSTGTLTERFLGTSLVGRLRAKTGYLRGVSALAGVIDVDADSAPELTFSYLLNDIDSFAASVPHQQALGDVLLTHPDAPPIELVGPAGYSLGLP